MRKFSSLSCRNTVEPCIEARPGVQDLAVSRMARSKCASGSPPCSTGAQYPLFERKCLILQMPVARFLICSKSQLLGATALSDPAPAYPICRPRLALRAGLSKCGCRLSTNRVPGQSARPGADWNSSPTRHQNCLDLSCFLGLRFAENQGEQKVSMSECKFHTLELLEKLSKVHEWRRNTPWSLQTTFWLPGGTCSNKAQFLPAFRSGRTCWIGHFKLQSAICGARGLGKRHAFAPSCRQCRASTCPGTQNLLWDLEFN